MTRPSVTERYVTADRPSDAEVHEKLNDLLAKWHGHCCGYQVGKGYPSADAACRISKSSSVWDGWNGAEEQMAHKRIMEAFDAAMWTIDQPFLTLLQLQARNLYTGRQVWASPRLAQYSDQQRLELLVVARKKLLKALANGGLLT